MKNVTAKELFVDMNWDLLDNWTDEDYESFVPDFIEFVKNPLGTNEASNVQYFLRYYVPDTMLVKYCVVVTKNDNKKLANAKMILGDPQNELNSRLTTIIYKTQFEQIKKLM